MIQNNLADGQLDRTSMALRLDYRWQSALLRALVEPWVVTLVETSGQVVDMSYFESTPECGPVIWNSLNWSTDTLVRLALRRDGPTVSEVRWLLSRFDDCNAGVKTLQLYCVFEGREMDCNSVMELTRRPSGEIVNQSRASLERFLCKRKLELEIATTGLSRFDSH